MRFHIICLLYDTADFQWIVLCYKDHMTACVITFWCIHLISLTTSVSAVPFFIEIMFILKVIKFHFKRSYTASYTGGL